MISAVKEAVLDSAYRRYGERFGKVILNHRWIKGLAPAKTKYGSPTAKVNSFIISSVGLLVGSGFHSGFSAIGRNIKQLSVSTA